MTLLLRSGIFALTLLVVSAIATSSCGAALASDVSETLTPAIVFASEDDTETFCNCHLKAELEHMTAVGLPLAVPANDELIDVVLAQSLPETQVTLTVVSLYPPPEQIPIKPPEQTWPVPLARAHL